MSFTSPLTGKKIAFITCGYPIDVSTMLINSLVLLAKANDVEIIVSSLDTRHERCPKWMQKHFIYAPAASRNFFYRVARRICREASVYLNKRYGTLAWWLKNADLFRFSEWFKHRAKSARYDIIIAVECLSLIATAASATNSCKVIYYNMELLDWTEENPLYEDKLTLKKLEHAALTLVSHVMITSESRARFFSENK